jgi:hypothetical protein
LKLNRTGKKVAKSSKNDRTQAILIALHQRVAEMAGSLNFLMTAHYLNTKDPRKMSAIELTDVGKALGEVHPDMLEVWAQRLADDPERQEALLVGVEQAGQPVPVPEQTELPFDESATVVL